MKYITKYLLLFLILFSISTIKAIAIPVISIDDDIIIQSGEEVDVPIYLDNITNEHIAGYILRLDYSDKLTNPKIIKDNTLSSGLSILNGSPTDGLGGKLAIGLMSGFNPDNDGIMLIIRFKALQDFTASNIKFLKHKTRLHNSIYKEIESTFNDGFAYSINKNYQNNFILLRNSNTNAVCDNMSISVPEFDEYGYIMSGHDNLPLTFLIPEKAEVSKILSRTWFIAADENKTNSIKITYQLPKLHYSPENYSLIRTNNKLLDPFTFSKINTENIVNTENSTLSFNISGDHLPITGFYTIGINDHKTEPFGKSLKYCIMKNFEDYILLKWEIIEENNIKAFQVWKKNQTDIYYQKNYSISIDQEKSKTNKLNNNQNVFSYKDYNIISNNKSFYKLEIIYFDNTSFFQNFILSTIYYSDVNKDNKINIIDALIILKYISE